MVFPLNITVLFLSQHPCIQKESDYIKFLCCDDEHTLLLWVNSIRIAKVRFNTATQITLMWAVRLEIYMTFNFKFENSMHRNSKYRDCNIVKDLNMCVSYVFSMGPPCIRTTRLRWREFTPLLHTKVSLHVTTGPLD